MVNLPWNAPAKKMTKEAVKKCMKQWDRSQWRNEVQSKNSLTTYSSWKEKLEEKCFLGNPAKSVVFLMARSNWLSLSTTENSTLEKIPLVNHECKNVKQESILFYHTQHIV